MVNIWNNPLFKPSPRTRLIPPNTNIRVKFQFPYQYIKGQEDGQLEYFTYNEFLNTYPDFTINAEFYDRIVTAIHNNLSFSNLEIGNLLSEVIQSFLDFNHFKSKLKRKN